MDRLRDVSKMPIEAQDMAERLKDERMEEREMDHAIRVTEEKLKVLKKTVEKRKAESVGKGKVTKRIPFEGAGAA
jgi:hypothetical protein